MPALFAGAATVDADVGVVVARSRGAAVELRPGCQEAAVDRECLPGDEARLVGREVERGLSDVLDIALIRPLARLGYQDYTVVDEVFPLTRPKQD